MRQLKRWRHDTQHNDIHTNNSQRNDTPHKRLISAECHCAECRNLFIGMLSVIRLNVVMLSVIRLNIVMLSVIRLNGIRLSAVAPKNSSLMILISAAVNCSVNI